jgi:hypothetical protein
MLNPETGKYIILAGCGIALIGIIIYFFHDKLHWMGHLPGDIRIEKENFKLYFPIVTMLILSILFTLLIKFIKSFFN